ncbi:MAG: hypothetical protein M1834_002873 [Cirrosporium novae-zelandiae]|nr:MAG: hypothetical protein M1834_002873 [Cirrosporium novae-zelandiae]
MDNHLNSIRMNINSVDKKKRKKIAIVGSGCSGLAALYSLRSTSHEVHIYESAERLGGHANTVVIERDGIKIPVDTGFIVLNNFTYPNFTSFLKEANIPTVSSEMTFSVTRGGGQFEWAGTSINSIFAQRSNLLKLSFWRMIFDIIRFNHFAADLLISNDNGEYVNLPSNVSSLKGSSLTDGGGESIDDYLTRENYSAAFRDDYLIPMTAAIWSTPPSDCALSFPILTLVQFMYNHHLLNTITPRPEWLSITGGSCKYIEAITASFPKSQLCVHMNTKVSSLQPITGGLVNLWTDGDPSPKKFDHVVLAVHGPQAADIMKEYGTDEEKKILGYFKTSKNVAVLHSDESLLPRRRLAHAAWNSTSYPASSAGSAVSVTFHMNILQSLPCPPILVTLNPPHPPRQRLTYGEYSYAHPLYTAASIRAQRLLPKIQGTRGVAYAGAWTGYGFHEDGWTSGLEAAKALGGSAPGGRIVNARKIRGIARKSVSEIRFGYVLLAIQFLITMLIYVNSLVDAMTPGIDVRKT